jgi:hypothetical protein
VVLHEDSCISTRGHSGGSVTPHPVPSSSDAIPMGSKWFALQGIEYAFLCTVDNRIEAVAVAKPATNQRPETQRPKAVWYSGLRP